MGYSELLGVIEVAGGYRGYKGLRVNFRGSFLWNGVLNETKTKHSFYSFKQSPGV